MDFTTKYHLDTYPALSPRRPELSQAGRTIFITGGAQGIGFSAAHSFAEAGAARLILMARRETSLAEAKSKLKGEFPKIDVVTYVGDITNGSDNVRIWKDLKTKEIDVDVLLLNAAIANTLPQGLAETDLTGKARSTFEMNVFSNIHLMELFLGQGPAKGKAIVSLSSAFYISPTRGEQVAYVASKAALCSILQGFADNLKPEETQIVSFNPGSVRTDATMRSIFANAPIAWNTATLQGDFAVWASSKEASFLHGRTVWSGWDVNELMAMKGIEHPGYCRIGLQGTDALSGAELFAQMTKARNAESIKA